MPPMRKPVFDEAAVLEFVAGEPNRADEPGRAASPGQRGKQAGRKQGKESVPDRVSLTLMLRSEIISLLTSEAGRKEKTVDQIVEKLVTKHLGKH